MKLDNADVREQKTKGVDSPNSQNEPKNNYMVANQPPYNSEEEQINEENPPHNN